MVECNKGRRAEDRAEYDKSIQGDLQGDQAVAVKGRLSSRSRLVDGSQKKRQLCSLSVTANLTQVGSKGNYPSLGQLNQFFLPLCRLLLLRLFDEGC